MRMFRTQEQAEAHARRMGRGEAMRNIDPRAPGWMVVDRNACEVITPDSVVSFREIAEARERTSVIDVGGSDAK